MDFPTVQWDCHVIPLGLLAMTLLPSPTFAFTLKLYYTWATYTTVISTPNEKNPEKSPMISKPSYVDIFEVIILHPYSDSMAI
ncbi:MAG: hypothetical protein HY276_05200 [Ignavibacteriales bacterium]|nr:hypothetical protein [Ignavibacteriales bacterium]MBI3787638.1 hypothetical protein [Ignavibacteriales bacterium]